MSEPMTPGEHIKRARKNAKLTQEELGRLVDVTGVSIMRYEKGERSPDYMTTCHLASALKLKIEDLMSETAKGWYEAGYEEGHAFGYEEALIQEAKEDEEFLNAIQPHLAPLDPLTDEESALKTLLNSMGYDIMKTRGNYFFTYESGGSEISKDDLCELLNCAQNGLKIAAKTLELKLLREAFGPRYPDEIVFPPPAQPPTGEALTLNEGKDTPTEQDVPEGAEEGE